MINADICLNKHGERVDLIEIDGPAEKKQALAHAIDEALKKFES